MKSNGNGLKSRKIGELVGVLAEDSKTLLRKEVELAKAELNERVEILRTDLGRDAAFARDELARSGTIAASAAVAFAIAAVFGLVALGLVAAMLTRLLDHAMSLGAALTVAFAIFALVAGAFALVGRKRLQRATPLLKPSTVASIKADAERAVAGNPVEQTVETVKEDVEWLKHPTRSETR